jgi:hypothetical protein
MAKPPWGLKKPDALGPEGLLGPRAWRGGADGARPEGLRMMSPGVTVRAMCGVLSPASGISLFNSDYTNPQMGSQ